MRGFQKVVKCKPSACISALLRCAYGNSKLHLRKHGLSCSMQINLSAAVKLGNISSVRLQYLGSPNFAKFFLVHHYYQGNVLHVPAKPCTSISNNFVVNSHVTKTRNSTASNIARAITRTYLVTPQAVRVRVQYHVSPVHCRVLDRPETLYCFCWVKSRDDQGRRFVLMLSMFFAKQSRNFRKHKQTSTCCSLLYVSITGRICGY